MRTRLPKIIILIVLATTVAAVQAWPLMAQNPPELYPCGSRTPDSYPGIPSGNIANNPPLVTSNFQGQIFTTGRLTNAGDLVEDGGLDVMVEMPTGTLKSGVPYEFRIKLAVGDDWVTSNGSQGFPQAIIGEGASGLTVVADGEGTHFEDARLAIDGRTVADGRADAFMAIVLLADFASLSPAHIIGGLVVHFVYEGAQHYLRNTPTAAYRFDDSQVDWQDGSMLTLCLGSSGASEAMLDAQQVEFAVEVVFEEPGQHTVTFFPDVRLETQGISGQAITGTTALSGLVTEYRRQITVQVPVEGEDAAGAVATNNILVLDVSGSMGDPDQYGTEKLSAAKRAARNFLDTLSQDYDVLGQNHRVGLVSFSDNASLASPLSTDVGQSMAAIDALAAGGGTNLGEGLYSAIGGFGPTDPSAPNYVVLMTDGQPTDGILTAAEFLEGPVQMAADSGICIHTVGFGQTGDLDETLLREIASASGCGNYYSADNAHQLNVTYALLRHENTGVNLVTFSDLINQGETKQLGTYTVPPGQGVIDASLIWPGSDLDLMLTDPNGRVVDETMAGVTFLAGEAMKRILVENPVAGDWLVSSFGRDVPEGTIPLDAIITTQPAIIVPPVADEGVDGGLIGGLLLLLGLGGMTVFMYTRGQGTGWAVVASETGQPPQTVKIGRNGVWVGRDPDCEVRVHDPTVSRKHCWIGPTEGRSNQLYIRDNNSTRGVERNGEKIRAGGFSEADRVRIGKTELRVSHR